MKYRLALVFVMAASLMAYGQGHGRPSGTSGGMGQGTSMGQGRGMSGTAGDMGREHGAAPTSRTDHGSASAQTQKPLSDSQIKGGSFRMLERKTGMTADQLKALYASSGAKNYGQFVSAVVVSKNLNLDTNQVLAGLKTKPLGGVLQDMGVSSDAAKAGIKKANQEIKDANKSKS